MKKAILHIGCEKTGSTSIQRYLHTHTEALEDINSAYLPSGGLISNYRLVILAHSRPDQDLLDLSGVHNDAASIQTFKQEFMSEHTEAVRSFQADFPQDSTAIYSSEHCHSRLTKADDIAVLKHYMDTLDDSVEVVVYIRRQDKLAMSAHNTAIQGGNQKRFNFEQINVNGLYYDYGSMLGKWSAVFGQAAMTVRLFEPARLHNQSVVDDFCKIIGLPTNEQQTKEERNNERLSYSAQETLLEFNRIDDNHSVLRGHEKSALRQDIIKLLHGWPDEHGSVRPSRQQALSFYAHFKEQNDLIAQTWLSGNGFDDNFDYYPEEAEVFPVLDTQWLLNKAISQCLGEISAEEASLMQLAG